MPLCSSQKTYSSSKGTVSISINMSTLHSAVVGLHLIHIESLQELDSSGACLNTSTLQVRQLLCLL